MFRGWRTVRVQRPIGVNHVVSTKSAPFSYTCHKSLRPRKAHGIPRLVSRYKNKGFVNSWYFQVWRMSLKPMEFQWFWCVHSMSNFKMSIKPKEFQWFWCVRSMSNFKMLIKPKELHWFWCVSQWANEPMSQSANPPTSQIGIRWSGTKKCSQRYEIDHFCLGIFAGIQPSEFVRDPVGESSVLPIQYPIYRWHQAEAWEVFGIRGWYVLSCTSRQISKFTVQA